ncbi:hypothetical protein CspeluHIS016_0503290 [Cutaneotrichosporon spelunceum]|uniref:NADP-dependent oxidoreductase domain-containing protein n=1 Tax=Cutaneotrichosporon spelunceum TaxID=1672016 RepID=A0AAD3YDT8_9TREE|nr:hypothetical protein CspeluHIS016_0503290 [Cutaneotrichosporon spelunceum]
MRVTKPVLSVIRRLKMNDGLEIPQLGMGTYPMTGPEAYAATRAALDAGYRHIDTAELYGNEADVGRAVRDSGLARSDVFVTSKLKKNRGYDAAFAALRGSLDRAGLDYFDLYLLHTPVGGPTARAEGWTALVDAQRQGLVRSVGVSNFGMLHLAEIMEVVRRAGKDGPGGAVPAVNQIDLSPFTRHTGIVDMCETMGTLMEAWAPLARGARFDHPSIVRVAEKYARSPAQVMIRWGVQHDYIVIPKSSSPKRIESNAQVFDFEIAPEDMRELDGLNEDLVTDWKGILDAE